MIAKLLVALLALLLGCFVATEVFAYRMRLDVALGSPWYRHSFFGLASPRATVAVYAPWRIVQWVWWWGWVAPRDFRWPAVAGVAMSSLVLLAGWWPRNRPATGEAHFATRRELQRAQCLPRWRIVWR
jgi:hypothetical protein